MHLRPDKANVGDLFIVFWGNDFGGGEKTITVHTF